MPEPRQEETPHNTPGYEVEKADEAHKEQRKPKVHKPTPTTLSQ
jgi:hypothetical protein